MYLCVCAHVTFLLGYISYYELPNFICRLSFIHYNASQVIWCASGATAEGHHMSKITVYFVIFIFVIIKCCYL